MKKKFLMLFVVLVLVNLFIYYGMPYLKEYKNKQNEPVKITKEDLSAIRPVTIDISVESICRNMITGDQYTKCIGRVGCEQTCKAEGCAFFGLAFIRANFTEGSCYCYCYEENKIKKALTGR